MAPPAAGTSDMSGWSMPATGGPRRALHRAGPLSLRCHLGGFAHRFGDPLLIRPVRLTIEQLREPGPVLLAGRGLRLGMLALLRLKFGAGGRDLGMQLDQIADRRPVLGSLGQELILVGSEMGQLGAEIALRAR